MNTDNYGSTIGTLKAPFVTGSTSASTCSTLPYDRLAKNSNSHNGSLSSSPIAAIVPASINSVNQIFGSGSHVACSTSSSLNVASTTTMASSNTFSISTAAPSFTTSPILRFGSSMSSNSVSVAPTTSTAEPSEINSKSEKEGTVGNLSRSVFGRTSFTTTTGGSIFGLSSSGTSSTTNCQYQGALFGTGNGLVSTQLSPSGSRSTAVSQSMPILFGSSAVFGTPEVTSSNSLFASSTPVKLFGSGSSFGLNSSASSAEIQSARSSSSGMSSTFNFGTSSLSSSSGANSISSSCAATPSIFNVDVSSARLLSARNSLNSNTAAIRNAFTFGASSSVSASVSGSSPASTVATPSVFTLGGSSSASCSGTNSISSISGATSNVFSSSWQHNLLSSTLSLASPTMFSFVASSSSFAATSSEPISSTCSIFSLTSSSTISLASQSQPLFGNSTSVFAAPSGNGDQMNMETAWRRILCRQQLQFLSLGNHLLKLVSRLVYSCIISYVFSIWWTTRTAPQFFSSFQTSTSLEFNAGGSFLLGSGCGDKSNQKFVKVNRSRNWRK